MGSRDTMNQTMSDIEKLYNCFTSDELQRLREIKSAPEWVPRQNTGRGRERDDIDSAQVNFVIPARLKSRLDARCKSLGITIREYMTALLEVMLA